MSRIFRCVPAAALTTWIILAKVIDFDTLSARVASLALAVAALSSTGFLAAKSEASPIHKGMAAYVAAATLGVWLGPEAVRQWFGRFPVTVFYAVLFLVAVLPPLLGREVFTTYFARKTTPPAVWKTDIFVTINRHLTALWAVLFAVGAAAALVPGMFGFHGFFWETLFEGLIPGTLMLGIGVSANKHYPVFYQRKRGLVQPQSDRHPASAALKVEHGSINETKPSQKEEKPMTVNPTIVAINGSPHAAIGNTAMMLAMVGDTLSGLGFKLDVIHLVDHEIDYCVGCALCLEKGKCWIPDDHAKIVERLLSADGIILASPVYFYHVTAQMKTFIDRSLALGHKPCGTWKPGLVVSVSAGSGETQVGEYLAGMLRVYGAFPLGRLTALATSPGGFWGKDAVEAQAGDLARDMVRAIREKRRYPATEVELRYYQFMSALVRENRDSMMRDDFEHWERLGLNQGFESYIQQKKETPQYDPEIRNAWIKDLIAQRKAKREKKIQPAWQPGEGPSARDASTCIELLQMMPQGFLPSAAEGLTAVYQFEISGAEAFTAHLSISGGKCTFHEGPADKAGVVIKSPAAIWLAISKGELDGQQAFMAGKYAVEGDLSLLMKLKSFFPAIR